MYLRVGMFTTCINNVPSIMRTHTGYSEIKTFAHIPLKKNQVKPLKIPQKVKEDKIFKC